MKINKTLIKEISLAVLSFVIPFITLIILFAVNKIALNNYSNSTIMMMDMQSEYIAYMRDLRRILLSNGSLIYTNSKVFGGDYLSIFTFYLSSPFNLFVVFFKEEAIPLFFIWSSLIKMAFASLNFYLLTRLTGKFTYQKIIFAIGYGLISYSFIFLSNYMWLDGVMILPLVILGLHYLKDKKKNYYWVYPISLGYSLLTSWYIGFMVAVFTTLFFLYLFFKDFQKEDHESLKFLIRFIAFSLVGGLISSSYWLTAFVHLSGTKGAVELPPLSFYSITTFITGFLENNYADYHLITLYNGYSSMFVGVVPLVFMMVFFFNKKFTFKERMILLGILLFYCLSALFSPLYALMHGGREPTWFPTRFSFIIGFLVCYLGSLCADNIEEVHPISFTLPLGMGIITIIILSFAKHSKFVEKYPISIPSVIMYFVTVIFASLICYFHHYPFNKLKESKLLLWLPHLTALLLVVQIASIYRGSDKVIKVNKEANQYQKYETYLKDHELSQSFEKIKQYDKETDNSSFYRMESTFNRPGNYNNIDNNPMFYSFNGISHFSSSDKKAVQDYIKKLGFHDNWFFSRYDGGSTFSMNSLLGIKYLVENTNQYTNIHPYFLDYDTFKKLDLSDENGSSFYKNDYAINLGLISDKTSSHFIGEGKNVGDKTYWYDHFEYQNQIFKTFVNKYDKDVFIPLTITGFSSDADYEIDDLGIYHYKNVKTNDAIRITFEVPESAYQYPLYFSEKDCSSAATYLIDGIQQEINTYWHYGIRSFRDISNHKHTLSIFFKDDYEDISIRPELYYENLDTAKEYLSYLKDTSFKVDKIKNGLTSKAYEGEMEITENNKDLIFTLPNETGIKVYVDNKLQKSFTKWNVFTAIDLSNISLGKHKVRIEYQDIPFTLSLPLSITSILGLVPLVIFYDKIELLLFKKPKEEEK